ncbi:hypothetical protein DSM104299_01293 [Baekduia alba]|uniref:RDD family protein n=1 Tax=Baekduia alba TaxID=2997333 RepID=UPI0023415366|nr:RDD family protein [Baekduia alba]WCB92596.1 hypothetical protein DSM104299_01293 [Baekduia alba]
MAASTAPTDVVSEEAAAGTYAGVVSRAIALGMDAAIVQGSLLLVAALLGLVASLVGGPHLDTAGQVIAGAVWLLATAAYFVIGWSLTGQTIGMRAMELTVYAHEGAPPTVARSIVRVLWLGLCIIPLFAGFLPALVDDRRRGLHDIVAGTVVVHTPARV